MPRLQILGLISSIITVITGDMRGYTEIIPVSQVGSPEKILLCDLSCKIFDHDSSHPLDKFEILLPFQERTTKMGYFCAGFTGQLICSPGWTSYEFQARSDKIKVPRSDCEDLVKKVSRGHATGSVVSTPDCSYWKVATKTIRKIAVVRVVLEFSPYLNGVRSSVFPDGLCQDRYCISSDGLSHWFLDESERVGCQGLTPGFGEISSIIRPGSLGHLVSTNLFSDVPLRDLCKADTYCGGTSVIGPDFKGFVLKGANSATVEMAISRIGKCKSDVQLYPIDYGRYRSQVNREDRRAKRMIECREIMMKAQEDNKISENLLTILTPLGEGIAPGYRIEGDILYKTNLLYIHGRFQPHYSNLGDRNPTWSIIDPSGLVHEISKSLCIYDSAAEYSLPGPVCRWYNGVQFYGNNFSIPKYDHGFRYIGKPQTYRDPDTLVTPSNPSPSHPDSTPGAPWEVTPYLQIGGGVIGLVFVGLIFFLCRCSRRGGGKKTGVTTRSMYSSRGGVIVEEIPDTPRTVRALPYRQQPMIMGGTIPRRGTQSEGPQGPPMLTWFE